MKKGDGGWMLLGSSGTAVDHRRRVLLLHVYRTTNVAWASRRKTELIQRTPPRGSEGPVKGRTVLILKDNKRKRRVQRGPHIRIGRANKSRVFGRGKGFRVFRRGVREGAKKRGGSKIKKGCGCKQTKSGTLSNLSQKKACVLDKSRKRTER